jgi:hypothetical protein
MKWRSYQQARKFARSLKLKNRDGWNQYCKSGKNPDDIPKDVASYYRKQDTWTTWGDFLGTGYVSTAKRKYKSFKDVAEFAQKLGIKSSTEWWAYVRGHEIPSDIPKDPSTYYKKEWTTWGDFLGTGYVSTAKRKVRSFSDARKFVRKLELKNLTEWRAYSKSGKRPGNIPANPAEVYKNKGWKNLGDWLGTGTIATFEREYRQFQQARKFVHTLKIKNRREWIVYVKSGKLPIDIRGNPRIYRNFTTWGDWLGTGMVDTRNRKYRQFDKARKFAQSLKLKNIEEWREYCKSGKKPEDIPARPQIYGSEKWQSFGDWLGTGTLSSAEKAASWLSPKEARIEIARIAKEVFGGKPFTPQDWFKAHDAGKIPKNIPKYLDDIYNPDSRDNRKKRKKK